ncbi:MULTISPECIES: YbaB/EbfC family nucleoid-associated protein [Saccharopolyspora]|uniref:YbaB/EbfC family DNA-binding protein n=1 Tax=Saccharopolyspora elongata TaxID=2530387 RepID=A0A4R4YV26_9PSEU|nr:YbaB/EbfC family nucleoid-associated protein [Saccharopolyspora elongata]TDD49183.1 YbaB/EbfC family DNA-binding protein [Saccharopolyspora elongata]
MSEPVFGVDGARTEEEIRRWAAGIQAKADRYQQMQQQVTAVKATAESRDGVVRVTVDSAGAVTDLQITDDARRMSGAGLAESVLTTMRQAQAGIRDQVAEVMSATVGDDTETVNAVVSAYRERFPDPEAEDGAERRPPDDEDFEDDSYLR